MFRTLVLLLCAGTVPAQAEDCPTLLRLKGYLNQAETRCGVREAAAPEHLAHACAERLGSRADPMLIQGMRMADSETAAQGSTAWCGFVRQTWASLIEP
jgi:hypothetical protein